MDWMTLLTVVGFGLVMWLLMIRPAQRRMREQLDTQNQIGVGNRVLLTSGIYGTVVHAGEKQLVVELAPGTDVTVLRTAVARVTTPDEEEFEFVDEPEPAVPAGPVTETTTVIEPSGFERPEGDLPAAPAPDNPFGPDDPRPHHDAAVPADPTQPAHPADADQNKDR